MKDKCLNCINGFKATELVKLSSKLKELYYSIEIAAKGRVLLARDILDNLVKVVGESSNKS